MDVSAVKNLTSASLIAVCMLISSDGLAGMDEPATVRHHDAHVHGEASGNLTQDGAVVRLELEIPGVNLVGFEHPPRNQDQRDQLALALSVVRAGSWLALDGRGRCELDSIEAHTHGFDDDSHDGDKHPAHDHHQDDGHHKHDHHGHDHHDHKHDHDHPQRHDHAEFQVVVFWQCEAADRLRWVEVDLFSDFPGNQRIVLDVLTERLARRFRLQPGQTRLALEP